MIHLVLRPVAITTFEVAEIVIVAEVVGFVGTVAAVVRHVAATRVRDAGTVSAPELPALRYGDA